MRENIHAKREKIKAKIIDKKIKVTLVTYISTNMTNPSIS
jgi:hypothetical protein